MQSCCARYRLVPGSQRQQSNANNKAYQYYPQVGNCVVVCSHLLKPSSVLVCCEPSCRPWRTTGAETPRLMATRALIIGYSGYRETPHAGRFMISVRILAFLLRSMFDATGSCTCGYKRFRIGEVWRLVSRFTSVACCFPGAVYAVRKLSLIHI